MNGSGLGQGYSQQAQGSGVSEDITAAPPYYDGKVVVGFAGGEYAVRGRISAYDAKNGKRVWNFHTVPGPGEIGRSTWPRDNEAWKYGGAPVWQTPSVDPEFGMIYFATGNAAPGFCCPEWATCDRAANP